MTLADDLAADYAHVDGIETVTLTDTSDTATTGVYAERASWNAREQAAGGVFGSEPVDAVWVLWAATLEGAAPEPGYKITDGNSDVWTVLSAERFPNPADNSVAIRYRCPCTKQK